MIASSFAAHDGWRRSKRWSNGFLAAGSRLIVIAVKITAAGKKFGGMSLSLNLPGTRMNWVSKTTSVSLRTGVGMRIDE